MFDDVFPSFKLVDYNEYFNLQTIEDSKVTELLSKTYLDFTDFLILLSPAIKTHLPKILAKAAELTTQLFGNTVQLYTPLYLSNECINSCVYCGFNCKEIIERKTLSPAEYSLELEYIKSLGFDNLLLLTGEHPTTAGVDYLSKAIIKAKNLFSYVALEIFPCKEKEYAILTNSGADGLTLYQETYNSELYKKYHGKGPKSNFIGRLNSPEVAIQAGFRKIGLGVLLGLSTWREDVACLGLHASYIIKKYWKTEVSLSFPRIKNSFSFLYPVETLDFIQIICAFRLFLPHVALTLSTREPDYIRDFLVNYGITQISAGSKTNPGGYSKSVSSGNQFETTDKRSLSDIMQMLKQKNIDPVIKDWSRVFSAP